MLSIITKNTLLYSRQEIWFYNGETIKHTNNDMFYASYVEPAFKTTYLAEYTTGRIDLKKSMDNLFYDMRTNYRNEVRRAEKLECKYEVIESPDNEFFCFYKKSYSAFAKTKGLPPNLSHTRLKAFADSNVLKISIVSLKDEIISIHSHVIDIGIKRAAGLYYHHNVAYTDNKTRGFANRFHHWKNILYFKEKGIEVYDYGRLDFVNTPGIADFKKLLGATLHTAYTFQTTSGFYGILKKITN